jgi:hypothetical protein
VTGQRRARLVLIVLQGRLEEGAKMRGFGLVGHITVGKGGLEQKDVMVVERNKGQSRHCRLTEPYRRLKLDAWA